MVNTDKRGEFVAVLGGLISLLAGVTLAVLAIWTGSSSVWAVCFQSLGTFGIWIITLIQLHQQRLVAEEKLEVAALERERRERLGGAQTIFDESDVDQMDKLAMGRRMRTIERYLVPVLALIIAGFHIAAGAAMLPYFWQFPPVAAAVASRLVNETSLLFFTGGIAFVCFMISRYALGLSRIEPWGLLRAGGNFMFGTSALCLLISVAILSVLSGLQRVEVWLGMGIGWLLIVLGTETLANFILDFYRPRLPGIIQRPFYDSRLLGMFSEPGGILRSMANAVDYQFGFKVSETWFYKLLGRAVLPLLLLQVLVLAALTCLVVVPPGHQAVIEHWGKLQKSTAKSGVHLTWPWPIDSAEIIPVERIRRMTIGFEEEEKHEDDGGPLRPPILWTQKHYKKEYMLLVADRAASANAKVPINLLSLNMPVHWRVKDADADVIRFYSQSQNAESIINALAYRELTRYAAQADVLDLLGRGGIEAARILHERIQEACDHAGYDEGGLGVQIVLVGIGGVHPPASENVAATYENVVSALETKDATIKGAEGDAAKIRISSAGTQWRELYEAMRLEEEAEQKGSPELPARTAEVERLLRQVVGGDARVATANASREALARLFGQKASAELYDVQLAAYNSAPQIYLGRLYLQGMADSLANIRKYIVVLEDPSTVIYDFDLRPPQLMDSLAQEMATSEIKKESQNP